MGPQSATIKWKIRKRANPLLAITITAALYITSENVDGTGPISVDAIRLKIMHIGKQDETSTREIDRRPNSAPIWIGVFTGKS